MKSMLMILIIAQLGLAGHAVAQCNPDFNEIGVFWDPDCTQCATCLHFLGGPTSAFVVLTNPTQPAGVSGFEFCLTNADGSEFMPPAGSIVFITGYTYPDGSINATMEPCFAVGVASPLPYSPCMTLIVINLLVFSPEPWCFGVKPLVQASIPGHMAYADGADPYLLLPMYPNTGPGATDYTMACLNHPDCPPGPVAIEETSWGVLKSLYR